MTIPLNEGDQTEEQIVELVITVRECECDDKKCFKCEDSFQFLRKYLSNSISGFERKYKIPGCDADEIGQECLVALRYKAIDDFDPERGKFRSFAILCMKRHLFSIIKGSNQQKRKILNESQSLDEDRSNDGENLSLNNIVTRDELTSAQQMEKVEWTDVIKERLTSKLSPLEKEVFELYIQGSAYEEIAEGLNKKFPHKKFTKKSVDNALVRLRFKAHELNKENEFF